MDLRGAGGEGGEVLGVCLAPVAEALLIHAADAVDQRGGAAAALVVDGGGGGGAALAADVRVAGGVDDDLGEDRLAAFLALEQDALARARLHDGLDAPAVVHDADGVGVLSEHDVHLDLELVGLQHEAVLHAGGPITAPGIFFRRVYHSSCNPRT